MKIAVILHGNLRTFFMPLREDRSRVCDRIYSNIYYNNADLFLVTDTTDFYHDGIHYFDEAQRDRIKDTSSTMFYNKIDFVESKKAEEILDFELKKLFKDIKVLKILPWQDISTDPKFILLTNSDVLKRNNLIGGSIPERIVNQYLKIKIAYNLIKEYEVKNNISYDLIFRSRFDLLCDPTPISLSSYDYEKIDIFTPGIPDAPFIYDWCAFGTRHAMGLALNLYDRLGSTLSDRLYRCECLKCGFVHCGSKIECKCSAGMDYDEMTLSSEYHLYKLFKNNNIKYASSCYPMVPYRYR